MNTIWISEHGEAVEEGTPGAFQIEVGHADRPDEEWLGDWRTEQEVTLNALEEALDAQHKRNKAKIKARRKYLAMAYDERLKVVCRAKMKASKTKAKSASFAYGKAGWTASTGTEITDLPKALKWAAKNAPDAIKKTPDALTVSKLPKGSVVPGVIKVPRNTFKVTGAKPKKDKVA